MTTGLRPCGLSFVKLLIENGVNTQHFLTIPRLEELYNTVSDHEGGEGGSWPHQNMALVEERGNHTHSDFA